jgi:hypothetical protein
MMLSSHYLDLGLALVPLYPKSKRPKGNDWQLRPITTPEELARLEGGNVGVHHVASHTVAFDIDNVLAKKALALIGINLDEMLALPGPKIITPNAQKPIYRLPEGFEPATHQLKFVNPQNRAENITVFELRAKGQDVLPPSEHPDGPIYQWTQEPRNREDIPELPEQLKLLFQHWHELEPIMQQASPWYQPPTGKKRSEKKHDDVISRFNDAFTVEEILERNGYRPDGERHIPPSSRSGIAGVTTFRDGNGTRCFSHNASDLLNDGHAHDAFDVMRLLECNGDMKQALDKAREYLGMPAFETKRDKRLKKSNDTVKSFNFVTANHLMQQKLPEPKEIVAGLLYEGVSLFAGRPKLGKSWLALGMSLATANGGKVLGKIPVEQGRALYLGLEDSPRRLQDRLLRMTEEFPEALHFGTEIPRMGEGGLEALDAWLSKHRDTKLVTIDTWTRFRPLKRVSDDDYVQDSVSGAELQKLALQHGIAILLVHHVRKMPAEDFIDTVSGSVGLTGSADSILVLDRKRQSTGAELFITGRDINENKLDLEFNPDVGSWSVTSEVKQVSVSQERQKILDYLKNNPTVVFGPRAIADVTGLSHGSVRHLLRKMTRDGLVNSDGNGGYLYAIR